MRLPRAIKLSVLALCWALYSTVASAQATTRSHSDPRPAAHAAKRTGPIAVDGRIDESAWAAATPIGELIQSFPNEGKEPSEKTEIRILYDEAAIYIGARMFDSLGPKGVKAVLTRRDALLNGGNLTSDQIAFVFDTFRDKNSRSWFQLNPLGVKGDHKDGDTSYDPVWDGASHIDSLGWTAEFRIPFSQLRFSRATEQVWGMQVWRTTDKKNEQDMWAFWRSNEAGGPAYFGTLDGITVASQPRQIEIVPYVTSRATMARVASNDPYHSNRQGVARAGGDAKLNITSNLTLDATVNPDFGQVEVDPASVNLSVFETTFSEKRPFFVSNSQYFSNGGFSCYFCNNVSSLNLIYTRRIGRSPQLAGLVGSRAQFMDATDATSILGAAKITGRTAGGLTVGLLDAVTNRETARYRLDGDATDHKQEVEPLANYFIGRVRKDFRNGATRIGAISTLVNRRLTNADEIARLRSRAGAIGFDIDHHWSNRTYAFNVQTALTNIAGDTSAIRRAQQSSARYYQRVGRTETTDGIFDTKFDPSRTTLSGYGLYARLAKESGDWRFEGIQNWRSPGFEANDMGVLSRADYKWMLANAVRQWTTPGKFYRNLWISAGAQTQLNYEGDHTDTDYHANVSATMPNFWNVGVFEIYHPSTFDERLTRGGPTAKRYGYQLIGANVSSDSRKSIVYGFNYNLSTPVDNSEGGRTAYHPYVTLKPTSSTSLTLSPSWDHDFTAQQFVTSFADPKAPAGFGNTRYVFGRLEQKTFSMDTRLNTTFTPNLTLELFAQPFLASGHYTNFKEFARPHSGQMTYYGKDNGSTIATGSNANGTTYTVDPDGNGAAAPFSFGSPDFNFRSLRGTAVVRYEYRPGSTLFFVWTQQRDGSAGFGDFDFSRDRSALFRDRPTNIFQVKATYWLGR
ncbi:MAG TPA: DUF5916 domain-containing protein [Gemmatimonadaceae bacterium]|nr:DUF5916 domain-containing protein [Gemmatimonadaceae bacterium]